MEHTQYNKRIQEDFDLTQINEESWKENILLIFLDTVNPNVNIQQLRKVYTTQFTKESYIDFLVGNTIFKFIDSGHFKLN